MLRLFSHVNCFLQPFPGLPILCPQTPWQLLLKKRWVRNKGDQCKEKQRKGCSGSSRSSGRKEQSPRAGCAAVLLGEGQQGLGTIQLPVLGSRSELHMGILSDPLVLHFGPKRQISSPRSVNVGPCVPAP